MRYTPLVSLLLGLVTAIVLWGCTGGSGTPLRREIAAGDRQKDWALVYFQSWRQAQDAAYLQMARRQMADAVLTYYGLQVKIGHSYPDFYIIDRKRRETCDFLAEMDRDALKFRVALEDTAREGCLR
jgi:hypothetical protein